MKKNGFFIKGVCIVLSFAMMLVAIPASVEADGPLVIHYFTADPITISPGEWSDLSWHVEPSDAIIYLETFSSTIHRGAAAIATTKVNPTTTTTYTLRAETWDDEGNVTYAITSTVTVFVGEAPAPSPTPPPAANQPPVASFTITPENPKANDTVEFTSTSSDPDGDILEYSWYINGKYATPVGNSSSWKFPDIPSATATIELVVDDGKGGTDSHTKTLTVSPGAITNGITSIKDQRDSDSPFLDTSIISFKGNVGGGTSPYLYFWDFGDGTDTGWLELKKAAEEIPASHQYACPGTYTVRRVVKDSTGAEAYAERDIVVLSTFMKKWNPSTKSLDNILPTISSEPVAGKYPDNFGHYYMKFTCHGVTGGYPPYSYYWDFGDGGNRGSAWSGQENTIVHDYWNLGQYTVSVTVFDSCNSEVRSSIPYDVGAAQEEDIKVLVVTSVSKMTAEFGASGWTQVEDRLKQLEWTILDIGTADVNAIDLQIEAKGANNIPKILILGGHGLVPFPVLPNPTMDGDTLYTDDVYADFDHDPQTVVDVPIARIPDGGDLGLILTQLSTSSPTSMGKFALANYRWPVAEAVANIFAASVLWSRPTLHTDLDPGEIMSRYGYFSLHGAKNNSSVWVGEDCIDPQNVKTCSYPEAFKVGQANSKGIILSSCCYGAYVINRSPSNSICLRFLKNGARCFIGCTGISYATLGLEPNAEAELFDKMFLTKLMEGKAPLQAFHQTKVAYAAQARSSSEKKIAHQYIYYGRP
jgi:PKD repeat protein